MSYRQGDDTSGLAPPPDKPVKWQIEVVAVVSVEAKTFHEAKRLATLEIQQAGYLCISARKVG